MSDQLTPEQTCRKALAVLDEVEKAVVGKRAALELVLLGVLAGGHVLIEDLPGLGKTLMARSFATALGLDFTRIQFTPDLLPSDVTGAPFYDQRSGEMVFRPGPGVHPAAAGRRDQPDAAEDPGRAAGGDGRGAGVASTARPGRLPEPFVVLATDNPIEYEGTYALPEAQLDRFLLRVRMGYLPPPTRPRCCCARLDRATPEAVLQRRSSTPPRCWRCATAWSRSRSTPTLLDYVVALVDATRAAPAGPGRRPPARRPGAGPAGPGPAVLTGRDYVTPEDVKAVAVPALAHRISLRPELWVRRVWADEVVASLLAATPTPRTLPRQQNATGRARQAPAQEPGQNPARKPAGATR